MTLIAQTCFRESWEIKLKTPLHIFSDLKISAKVGGGFAVVLAITGLVGIAGIFAVSQLNTKIDNSVSASKAMTSLQKLSAARENYLTLKGEEQARLVSVSLGDLNGDLDALLTSVGGTPSEQDVMEAIGSVDRMKTAFDDVTASVAREVDAIAELESRSQKLNSSADTVGNQLKKILKNLNGSITTNREERSVSLQNAIAFDHVADELAAVRSDVLALALGEKAAGDRILKTLEEISVPLSEVPEAIRSKRKRKKFVAKMQVLSDLPNLLTDLQTSTDLPSRAELAQEIDVQLSNAVAAVAIIAKNSNKIFLNTDKVYQQTEVKIAEYSSLLAEVGNFKDLLVAVEANTLRAMVSRKPDTIAEVQNKTEALLKATDQLAERTKDEAQVSSTTGSLAGFVEQYNKSFQSILAAVQQQGDALKNFSQYSDQTRDQVSIVAQSEAISAKATGQQAILMIAIAIASAIAIATCIAVFLSIAISRPVRSLTQVMTDLASGFLDVNINGTSRRDEIGDMSRAVEVFLTNAVERNKLEEEQRETEIRRAERHERVDTLISEFRAGISDVLDTVHGNMDRMKDTAEKLTEVAENTTERTRSAQGSASNTSQNVQTVASAAEELSSSITEISRQINTTTGIIHEASERADDSNSKVAGLSTAAQRIGDVVSLIQAIAEQTNLLALNATIEAARAGEAGKGFSVVAAEVKELATQTSKATEEISSHISEIQSATQETVDSIETISKIMSEANEHTTSIAAAVDQQGAATSEINGSIQSASNGTMDVSNMMLSLVENMDQTKEESLQVRETSETVVNSNEDLQKLIDTFLRDVTAA